MALPQPTPIFGIFSITPYNRTTKQPYGIAQVVQSGSVTFSGDVIQLRGGANRYAWAAESGDIEASLAFSISEYPDWLFTLFGGKAPTVGSAEASGAVSTPANVKGTSVVSATTGVTTTPTVVDASKLKFGTVVIVADDTDELSVYYSSNVDFGRGGGASYTDGTLKVASFTGITNGSSLALTDFGITLTAGSGVALVAGDTAYFTVRPVNSANRRVKVGGAADVFPEFGCWAYAEKQGTDIVQEIEVFRAKVGGGLTLGAERKAYANQEYSATLLYDASEDAVLAYSEIQG